jgi:ubiquinone/menaquinone biosynthesis C-methylase UbiE
MQDTSYILRGGSEGRARLRLLARVLQPTTRALFDRIGIRPGMACLDIGCGGGDVTLQLASRVGASGRVVGIDRDDTVLELARHEAEMQQVRNAEFRRSAIMESDLEPRFDLVYARFLLTHLPDPASALIKMRQALRPGGGLIAVEDIDFTGHFCHPDSPALSRYVELYSEAVRRRGGDPNIGLRLPQMLVELGCENVQMYVVQPAALDGEAKVVNAITMENIADAVLAAGLASREDIDRVIAELYEFAHNRRTLMSTARVIQTWGLVGPTAQLPRS